MKDVDKLEVGDKVDDLTFRITPELNNQLLESIHCNRPEYKRIVHPSILIGFSNITRSPSYSRPFNVATVHSHDEVQFLNQGLVGDEFTVHWEITGLYEKRNRKYQIKEARITSNDKVVLTRKITDTHIFN